LLRPPGPGRLGAATADALVNKGYVVLTDEGGDLTGSGVEFLARFGVNLVPELRSRRIFCRPCLDWSERRYHVAGHVGSEILRRCVEVGWLERARDHRAVTITPAGRAGLLSTFGIAFEADLPMKIPAE